jgi:hypothetical protein
VPLPALIPLFSAALPQGLNKVDMVTMVTGSHAIGGLRQFSSPDHTSCPYAPFDCTPAGQISAAPFDNSVFKVACDGVRGVSKGACAWNTICTNPSVDETARGCPFTGPARAAFAACSPTSYPTPGLSSGECCEYTIVLASSKLVVSDSC